MSLDPAHSPDLFRLPDGSYERALARDLGGVIAGLDEVGRGPLAGPVMACAVILDPADLPEGLADSKTLSARKRDGLAELLQSRVRFGLGEASVAEIDAINILQATFLAMRRAFAAVCATPGPAPILALVDGNKDPGLGCPARPVVKGDGKVASIAAASIIAKVTRDRLMADLHTIHPHYGWDRNAGYPTKAHLAGLAHHGVTPHHRRSFAPVHNILYSQERNESG